MPLAPLSVTTSAALDDPAAWDELVARQPLPSPFHRSWWLGGAAGHEPVLVLVHDGDRLVGGLPLEVDRRLRVPRYLALGSALAPDHLDLVAEPGLEDAVTEAIGGWFAEQGSCAVDISCAAGPARLLGGLPGATAEVVEHAPWTPLGDDFDAYLRARPDGLAKRVSRARKKLAAEGVAYHRAEPGEVERSLEALRRLHGEVFGEGSLWLPYFDRFAVAARAGVAAGELVFHQLRTDDEVVAIDVVFEIGSRISTYQGGRSTDRRYGSSGAVLQAAFLEDGIARGFTEFDHLRGVTDYKRSWCDEQRDLTRIRWTAGALGRAASAVADLASHPGLARLRGRRAEPTG